MMMPQAPQAPQQQPLGGQIDPRSALMQAIMQQMSAPASAPPAPGGQYPQALAQALQHLQGGGTGPQVNPGASPGPPGGLTNLGLQQQQGPQTMWGMGGQ